LLNLRAGIERGGWRVALWMRNALDEDYVPVAFQSNPSNPAQFVGESGAPQQVGLSVSVSL
jgi:outer membrane receptor protein involved in Fe transport